MINNGIFPYPDEPELHELAMVAKGAHMLSGQYSVLTTDQYKAIVDAVITQWEIHLA